MTEPTSNNMYRWFPKCLRVITVYLVTIALTMGVVPRIWAEGTEESSPIAINYAVLELAPTEHETILTMLLTAEMAASRHLEATALQQYLEAAEKTKNPNIAEQATQLAINYQSATIAAKSAELWANTAPKNLQAQLVAMTLSIGQSIEKTIPFLNRALEINPLQVDQYVIEIQARLSEGSAQKLKEALNQVAILKPTNPYAHLLAAQSAAQQNDIKNANRWVDSALGLMPNLTHALMLKARLIRHASDSDTKALSFLAKKVEAYPNNGELRLFYSSALIDSGNRQEAKLHLTKLTRNQQVGGQALIFLSEIYLKENKLQAASETLKKALDFPESREIAQYLLGEAEERQGHIDAAIGWYSEVSNGSYQIPAILRAVALLKNQTEYKDAISLLHNATPNTVEEQKQLILAEIDLLNASQSSEEAMELSNELLSKLPTDSAVLFSHAITAGKLKKWEVAENDLEKILKQNPNNPSALNALGYILSFDKNRLDEAIRYLDQALVLAPNNPVFMDSLGWIHYRLGNVKEAVQYLKKAHTLSDDAEIAAHYGEILWANNNKEQAKMVWKKALEKNNENIILLDTLKRLNIDLKP